MENQRGGGRFGSKRGGPITKTSLVDPVGSLRQEVKERVGQEVRVDQNSLGQANKLDEILSSGRYVTSARDDI